MKNETMNVPLFNPEISKADKKVILDSLQSSILSGGPNLKKFERLFAKYMGTKFAIGVSSATAALHLSLLSQGIGKGDEVIIPDFTFVATANAVALTGAKAICADIDSTLNISIKDIERKITKKTKAVIVVHFSGVPCKMNEIKKIVKKYNLKLIEDCAHAIGAKVDKKFVGTFGDTGCYSFFATKNMTTIEGGMITTNSKAIANKVNSLRAHGITKSVSQRYGSKHPWDYDVNEPGYNFKLDEIRSSLGISQLSRLGKIIKKRQKIARYYDQKLKNVKGIEISNLNDKNHVYHLYIIKITDEFRMSRNAVHEQLKNEGIQTTVHYRPIHEFSLFKKNKAEEFPNTTKAFAECLSIPFFVTITKKQQNYVIRKIKDL
jgi:perosamine synthetase